MNNDPDPLFKNIKELMFLINYSSTFDAERNKRWVNCSHKFYIFDTFIISTIQGLGKLDAKLIAEDDKIKNKNPSNPFGDVSDHITLSYLWVLGAYEIIRSIDQRAKEDPDFFPGFKTDIKSLKHDFERVRIPLAKFEAAKRFSETDSHIAYPGFHSELGTSWQLSANTWINRRTLSDNMLSLFEKMKAV